MGAAPSFADVAMHGDVNVPPPGNVKGGNKGKRGNRKGKGKGGDADPTLPKSNTGNDSEPTPEAVTTPLVKAKALAKAVLLDSCYTFFF